MTLFLPEQIGTLRELSDLWPDTPFVLIGANALALQMDLQWRQTNDLDFVISIALEEYPAGLATLPGWRRRREGEHAWLSPTGVKVDIVPAGPGLLAAGSLTWPESGYRMNLLGLRLAFAHHVRVAIDDRDHVEVATTPAIVVLKMVAFLDRPDRGEPGGGKTTLLERLVLEDARAHLADRRGAPLPLYVLLPWWTEASDVPAFLQRHWPLVEPLESALRTGEVSVFLDGLNEMGAAGKQRAEELKKWIKSWVGGEGGPRRLEVTCRRDDYQDYDLELPRVDLSALDESRMARQSSGGQFPADQHAVPSSVPLERTQITTVSPQEQLGPKGARICFGPAVE